MFRNRRITTLIAGLTVFFGGAAFADTSVGLGRNMFGGPVYEGAPVLEVTAALVEAGGGAENFTFSAALVSLLGEDTANGEVVDLNKQYGPAYVTSFLNGMAFVIKDGLKRASEAGVALPEARENLKGADLARALVDAGTVDGTFWSGYLFDKVLSHSIHNRVMTDFDLAFSHETDENTHRILNHTMYAVAHVLDMTDVELATRPRNR